MKLTHFHASNFRNLSECDLSPSEGVNLVLGPNGSGKTSILEAIYVLGRVKSFRTTDLRMLIQRDTPGFLTRGVVEGELSEQHRIGVRKVRGNRGVETRLDGEEVSSREAIGAVFPLLLLNGESYRLIEGGPKYRRQFVDWGMFHVEHSGREAWREYRRALKQRNAALRSGGSQLQLWTGELVTRAVRLDAERRTMIERLNPYISRRTEELMGMRGELAYRTAWESDEELLELLSGSVESDRQAGYTRSGPHAANVVAAIDGVGSRDTLSRGQTKLLVYSLVMSLGEILQDRCDTRITLLVDDMAAELDDLNQQRALTALAGVGCQLFITSIHPPSGCDALSGQSKVFHVKQGALS